MKIAIFSEIGFLLNKEYLFLGHTVLHNIVLVSRLHSILVTLKVHLCSKLNRFFREWNANRGVRFELLGIVSGKIPSADDLYLFVAHRQVNIFKSIERIVLTSIMLSPVFICFNLNITF